MKFVLSYIFINLLFLCSCKKEVVPSLETSGITGITTTSAVAGGTITDEGSGTIIKCGVCWNIISSPTIENSKSIDSPVTGSFTSNMTGLSPSTKYYVRAYATNEAGTGYGEESTFTTFGQAPAATSSPVSEVTSSGAKLNGIANANYLSTQIAFEYGLTTAYGNTITGIPGTLDGSSDTPVTGTLTGLIPASVYHFRIKATNSLGTTYSDDQSFNTLSAIPVVTTTEISNKTGVSVSSGGTVSYQGNSPVLQRGICWSINTTPTIEDSKTSDGTGTGTFTSLANGLTPATSYHLRAYATNSEGTGYGNDIIFVTNAIPATLTTSPASGVSSTSVTVGGNISNNGGGEITERGVCWSKNHDPLISENKSISSSGNDLYTVLISGLRGSTTYYARAYAINTAGTAYGDEISFTTNPPVFAILNTSYGSSLTTSSASVGVMFETDGGADVTARGICWRTTSGPTVADNKTSEGVGSLAFHSSMTGLDADTKYYVRSYAVTSWGTSYGNEITLRTYAGTLNDVDGNTYYTVKLGSQLWMADNLRVTKFSNGDPIATTTPPVLSIVSESAPIYQWSYNGQESNVALHGRLYTGYVAVDSRNVCPVGWHVPTTIEWSTLISYLTSNGFGFGGVPDYIAKSIASQNAWTPYSALGVRGAVGDDLTLNNSSGFNGTPGGLRYANGEFCCIGGTASWWTQTPSSSALIHYFILYVRPTIFEHSTTKHEAASIRCVKD